MKIWKILALLASTALTPSAWADPTTSLPNDTITGTVLNRLVKSNGSGGVVVVGSVTDIPIGIVTANAGTAFYATIAVPGGQAKCEFSGSTVSGDYVTFNALGQCVDAGTLPGNPDIGIVSTTATGAGVRTVLLIPGVFASITTPGHLGSADFANVYAFGAKGDGSTDDTVALQNAAASLNSQGGVVWLPAGHFCKKSAGLLIDPNGPVIYAGIEGQTPPLIDSCGADVGIFSLSKTRSGAKHVQISGSQNPLTTHDTITLSGVEQVLEDFIAVGGRYTINASAATDTIIAYPARIYQSYGGALIYAGPGTHIHGAKMDWGWPGTQPNAGSLAAPGAWAAMTPYTANTSVVYTGSGCPSSAPCFYLQAIASGTSGGTAPTVPAYGNTVIDGTVQWQLVAPKTCYIVQVDNGATAYIGENSDLTAPCTAGIAMTGSGSFVSLSQSNIGAALAEGVLLASTGGQFQADGDAIESCLLTTCYGVLATGSWPGSVTLFGNQIWNNSVDVEIDAGAGATLTGNKFGGATTCVNVAANISGVTITGNAVGAGGVNGPCSVGVNIAAGSGSHNRVLGNTYSGTSTPVTFGTNTGGSDNIIENGSGGILANQLFDNGTRILGCIGCSWTPTDASGASLTFSSVSAEYDQIGNVVFARFNLTYPSTASSAQALIGGLPVTVANHSYNFASGACFANGAASVAVAAPNINTTQVFIDSANGGMANSILSGSILRCTFSYTVS